MSQHMSSHQHGRTHGFGAEMAMRAREHEIAARIRHCERRLSEARAVGTVHAVDAALVSLGRELDALRAGLAQLHREREAGGSR